MKNKITIIGAGFVGSTTAYSLIAANITEEIAIIDINKKLAISQVMDLQHSVPFWGYTKVKVGSYKDVSDSKIVIICCGAKQKPGESRLDLVKKNSAIIEDVAVQVFKNNPNVIVLMVTNPVDVLTYLTIKKFPKNKKRIIGTGTILDSARFRFLLGQYLNVNPQSVHAYIVGEHGDSEVPLWSTASIGNTLVRKFKQISPEIKKDIFQKAKNAAYAIIEGKQATYYAIAAGTTQIVESILFDKKRVLPISYYLEGEYGIKDVCLSLPVVLGRDGVIERLEIDIDAEEKRLLKESARKIKKVANSLSE
ncbi:MAG: L-lactate dehydrogenase [Candidatus Nealsonbacteria bacterium]|nr:L-lactate dehydrogenase [Candidatus Nealsonbacteria bacterium]